MPRPATGGATAAPLHAPGGALGRSHLVGRVGACAPHGPALGGFLSQGRIGRLGRSEDGPRDLGCRLVHPALAVGLTRPGEHAAQAARLCVSGSWAGHGLRSFCCV